MRHFLLFCDIRSSFLTLCFDFYFDTIIIIVVKIFGFGYKPLFNDRWRFLLKLYILFRLSTEFSLVNQDHYGYSWVAYVWLLSEVEVILRPLHRLFAKFLPHFELELILVAKDGFSLLVLVFLSALILQLLFLLTLLSLLKLCIFFYSCHTSFETNVQTKQTDDYTEHYERHLLRCKAIIVIIIFLFGMLFTVWLLSPAESDNTILLLLVDLFSK